MHHVNYSVTEQNPFRTEIYYLDPDPPVIRLQP